MLENIKAVLFDLDGTLVDSMWMWEDIDREFLKQYGLSLPEDLKTEIEGNSFTETAIYFKNRFGLILSVEEIKKEIMKMAYVKYTTQVPLKPGAASFLEELKSKGILCGIATSNGIELVNAVLTALNVKSYFDSIRTCCDVKVGKPAPDIYLKVAEDLGVEPEKCLVFEDIPAGIMAGKNAGMKVCAVNDEDSSGQDEKKRVLADYYINSYEEVLLGTYEVLTR